MKQGRAKRSTNQVRAVDEFLRRGSEQDRLDVGSPAAVAWRVLSPGFACHGCRFFSSDPHMSVPADEQAWDLLKRVGPTEAWQTATREAIDAHLANDHASRDYWRAVQNVLRLIAPRPGPGNRDIYRSAQLLIARHGAEEAWRLVMKQADEDEGLAQQATTLRIADAVHAMSPGGPEEGRTKF